MQEKILHNILTRVTSNEKLLENTLARVISNEKLLEDTRNRVMSNEKLLEDTRNRVMSNEKTLDNALMRIINIEERLKQTVTQEQLEEKFGIVLNHIDQFVRLHTKLDTELAALRHKYNRLGERVVVLETEKRVHKKS